MKGVYVFLAEGFEEIEALTAVDLLRRGGVEVNTVSVPGGRAVTGAHGISVVADMEFTDFQNVSKGVSGPSDAMVFPGGLPGATNLAAHGPLMEVLREHFAAGGLVAAICAAPSVVLPALGQALEGYAYTCYGGNDAGLNALGAVFAGGPAVVSGNLISGRGPGCAVEFALSILEALKGGQKASAVRSALLI